METTRFCWALFLCLAVISSARSQEQDQQPSKEQDQQPSEDQDQQPSENQDQQPSEDQDQQPSEDQDQQPSEDQDQQPSEEDLSVDSQGLCSFECSKGRPIHKPGYVTKVNGCGSYGFTIEIKKCPYLKDCCNRHDLCYGTCDTSRATCDKVFKTCTQNQPKALSKDNRGLCSTIGSAFYKIVRAFGCLAFKNAQKKACICPVKI